MGALATVLVAALTAASTGEVEREALRHVVREFERVGRTAPQADPVLTTAARQLAREALTTGADDAADLLAVAQVVSEAGGADPTPRAVVVRATPADYALRTFLSRTDYNEQPATHVGVGVVNAGDRAVVVALLADRQAVLRPFPRALSAPGTRRLCGSFNGGLRRAELYVTRPTGAVDRIPVASQRGREFCAQLPLAAPGRHTVEIVGRGDRGPEVAALFFVDVGVRGGPRKHARIAEPRTREGARAELLVRINGLRQAHGLAPLVLDERLGAVAQAHSDDMAQRHFFAHVAPGGEDLRARLVKAGYPYTRAGENLGLAAGPIAAHFAIEHSPGHRRNLLDGDFTVLGIGIAEEAVNGRTQTLLTQVLARPTTPPKDPLAAAYQALDKRRAARGLAPLKRNPVLEAIALEHARRALSLDQPRIALPGTPVHERVFEAMSNVKTASVDFFVSDDPSAVPPSRSLEDKRNDAVGVGAVRGDSTTYGPGKYWVVVIYAGSK